MTVSQLRIAETIDHFYDEGAPLGYAGMQYKTAVQQMDEEAKGEIVKQSIHQSNLKMKGVCFNLYLICYFFRIQIIESRFLSL
jgi:hypothetical protein